MADWQDPRVSLLLAEYQQLKAEQMQRISLRDNLIYANFVATAAVAAFAVASDSLPYAWLAIPVVCLALGWTFVANDRSISRLRDYFRGPLRRQAAALTGDAAWDAFGWEDFHRAHRRRRQGKLLQLLTNLSVFVLPGIAAIMVVGFQNWTDFMATGIRYDRTHVLYFGLGLEAMGLFVMTALLVGLSRD